MTTWHVWGLRAFLLYRTSTLVSVSPRPWKISLFWFFRAFRMSSSEYILSTPRRTKSGSRFLTSSTCRCSLAVFSFVFSLSRSASELKPIIIFLSLAFLTFLTSIHPSFASTTVLILSSTLSPVSCSSLAVTTTECSVSLVGPTLPLCATVWDAVTLA
ncbi:unnamed protein product [Chrysodeixis includens]|uniref:Uncharacterized protein n=1 Tax=Chrysodeixis includens TaxID=689277 RepID=A0A9N8PZ38_CHRIL|nr:unnamed protein product [Chrysodeixis includens]